MIDILEKIRKLVSSKSQEKAETTLSLKEKYAKFQKLLAHNNAFLKKLAYLNEHIHADDAINWNTLKAFLEEMKGEVREIITTLNELSNNKYTNLFERFDHISSAIDQLILKYEEIPESEYIIPLSKITKDMVIKVGGKSANLGEIRNALKVPTPEGFAVTSYAFKKFLETRNLTEPIKKLISKLDPNDLEALEKTSQEIQALILNSSLPSEIEDAIEREVEGLCSKGIQSFSVRSSAIFEDSELSFAGQYNSFLNVKPSEVTEKYKEVVASLYNPRALFYYRKMGFPEGRKAMAVAIMEMIDALAGGVIYSTDPNAPNQEQILLSAVWGLGKCVVEGTITPEVHILDKSSLKTIKQKIPLVEVMLVCRPDGTIEEVPVPEDKRGKSCLTEDQIKALAQYALAIESHFGSPQDIEWAINRDGKIYILQTRPLMVLEGSEREMIAPPVFDSYRILIREGDIACRGIGFGKAFVLLEDKDLKNFPQGAILVAKKTSPKFVTIMDKASAIITDVGCSAGHMASLAREFGVPTIVNAEIATKVIMDDQEITVDAINGIVYEGRVLELLEFTKKSKPKRQTELQKTTEKLLRLVVPLNLIDPSEPTFAIDFCQTFHDITRFCHEKAKDEMFKLSEESEEVGEVRRLISGIPLNMLVIDLGNGTTGKGKTIRPEEIRSIPFLAFFRGLSSLRWPDPPPVDAKGFLGLIATTVTTPEQELRERGLESYAFLAENYMNVALRLGYHLSTVEAYVSDNVNDNYIRFLFKGGGAALERRLRRVRLITEILKRLDFSVKVVNDLIDAELAKHRRNVLENRLEILGRLTVFTKQLDMVMYNDSITNYYIEKFIKEHMQEIIN